MPKIVDALSNDELSDIIDLLKKGETLPEDYRFRLFNSCHKSELIWPGKNNLFCKAALPFQTIEHIDTPKLNHNIVSHPPQSWCNKLIWGDNKFVLSSLLSSPLRKEIENIGGIKLVYIDPPFDIGADFSMPIEIGDGESFIKEPSIIEEIAYRDTWGKGVESYLAMIYERLSLISELLATDASIYVHCDWRISHYIGLVMDEIFGKDNMLNMIIWKSGVIKGARGKAKKFGKLLDHIYLYSKSSEYCFNNIYKPYDLENKNNKFIHKDKDGRIYSRDTPLGDYSEESIKEFEKNGRIYTTKNGKKQLIRYLDELPGLTVGELWDDINPINQVANERLDYPTQKPESLLERIISASSNEGDLIADFFCGSGTTLAVAEKLNRKWIGCDLSRFAVHTSRKRLINVQTELNASINTYNPFEILNLGHYDRQYYMGIDPNLPKEQRALQAKLKEEQYYDLIRKAYKASPSNTFPPFHGYKVIGNYTYAVYIGSLDSPVTTGEIDTILNQAEKYGFNKVDILGFEFEMGVNPEIQDRAIEEKNITLALRYIPREVFDKRAIEKNQVIFYDASFVEAKIINVEDTISVRLTDFGVFYRQENIDYITSALKSGGSKVVVDQGQVIKLTKTRDGIKQEILTKNWTDWIDYWSVDFDYESLKDSFLGNNIFENQWQTFRTKNNRKIVTESERFKYLKSGHYKVAIKIIDIFGHDTTKVFDIHINTKGK
ncbi:TPA: site-specific DNA-methyltransferase [Legionella pneumophila]